MSFGIRGNQKLVITSTGNTPNYWSIDASQNIFNNNSSGRVNIMNVTGSNASLNVEGNSGVWCSVKRFGNSPRFEAYRARGTKESPLILQNNDEIGSIQFLGYNGVGNDLGQTGFVRNVIIYPFVRDVSNTTITPALAFGTGASSSLNDYRMVINNGGEITIGKGLTAPQGSAILELQSTSKGFLPPRMSGVQANAIASPAEGLMVYINTTGGTPFNFSTKGWYGYNGTTWEKLNN